jgi:hypothetical protein
MIFTSSGIFSRLYEKSDSRKTPPLPLSLSPEIMWLKGHKVLCIHGIKENLPPIRVIKRDVNTFLRLGFFSEKQIDVHRCF